MSAFWAISTGAFWKIHAIDRETMLIMKLGSGAEERQRLTDPNPPDWPDEASPTGKGDPPKRKSRRTAWGVLSYRRGPIPPKSMCA